MRDKHVSVIGLKAILADLRDDDVICTGLVATGNWAVLRDRQQIGWIELAPADVGTEWPEPVGSFVLTDEEEALGS